MNNVFGTRLRELRLEAGLKQCVLAQILHVSRSTITGYETRGRMPDMDTLCAIADYFNVSLDYLIGRGENNPNNRA